MEQVNTYILFLLGKWLDSTFLSAREPINQNLLAWQSARAVLNILIAGDLTLKLKESDVWAVPLRDLIHEFITSAENDSSFILSATQIEHFGSTWSSFEQALALDLGRAPIFFVTDKGIYSTPSLYQRQKRLSSMTSLRWCRLRHGAT